MGGGTGCIGARARLQCSGRRLSPSASPIAPAASWWGGTYRIAEVAGQGVVGGGRCKLIHRTGLSPSSHEQLQGSVVLSLSVCTRRSCSCRGGDPVRNPPLPVTPPDMLALFHVRVGNFLADVLISLISLSNQGIEIEPNISPVPARNGSKFRHRILHKVHKHKQWTTQQQTSNGPRSNKPTSNEPTSGTSKLKLQVETTSTTTPPASRATPRPGRW